MRHAGGVERPGRDPATCRADEGRLGALLARAYSARDAHLAPSEDALARLNATLDAIQTPRRRRGERRHLLGACALVALLLVLLVPLTFTEIAPRTPHAAPAAGAATGNAPALPGLAAAIGGATPVGRCDARQVAAPGTSATPLRDLMARAGIYPSGPPDGRAAPASPAHK